MSQQIQGQSKQPKCDNNELLSIAYCLSRDLFDKPNTCREESFEQICQVKQVENCVMSSSPECYEGFYIECGIADSNLPSVNDQCIALGNPLPEWCMCQQSNEDIKEESIIKKDCVCFPFRRRPYTMSKISDRKIESCNCSNIYRKQCTFPKNKPITDTTLNCISLNRNVTMESKVNCDHYQQKLQELEKNKTINLRNLYPHWSSIHSDLRNRLHLIKEIEIIPVNQDLSPSNKTIKAESENRQTNNSSVDSLNSQSTYSEEEEEIKQILNETLSRLEALQKMVVPDKPISSQENKQEYEIESILTKILGNPQFADNIKMQQEFILNGTPSKDSSSSNKNEQTDQKRKKTSRKNGWARLELYKHMKLGYKRYGNEMVSFSNYEKGLEYYRNLSLKNLKSLSEPTNSFVPTTVTLALIPILNLFIILLIFYFVKKRSINEDDIERELGEEEKEYMMMTMNYKTKFRSPRSDMVEMKRGQIKETSFTKEDNTVSSVTSRNKKEDQIVLVENEVLED